MGRLMFVQLLENLALDEIAAKEAPTGRIAATMSHT